MPRCPFCVTVNLYLTKNAHGARFLTCFNCLSEVPVVGPST